MSNFNVYIEACVAEGETEQAQGMLFQDLVKKFLEADGHKVVENLRVAGSEIDLRCINKATDEAFIVECKAKAHRDKIPTDTLTKLMGIREGNGYKSAWLITTAQLNQDAKGFLDNYYKQGGDSRSRLIVYPPDRLVERLIGTHLIRDPNHLDVKYEGYANADEAFLLVTVRGNYWVIPLVSDANREKLSAMVFDAKIGSAISDRGLLDWLGSISRTTREYGFLTSPNTNIREGGEVYGQVADISIPSQLITELLEKLSAEFPEFTKRDLENFLKYKNEDFLSISSDIDNVKRMMKAKGHVSGSLAGANTAMKLGDTVRSNELIRKAEDIQLEENTIAEVRKLAEIRYLLGQSLLFSGKLEESLKHFESAANTVFPFKEHEAGLYRKRAGRAVYLHGLRYGGPSIEKATVLFKRSLIILTKQRFEDDWAEVKNFLGESYRIMGKRGVSADTIKCIENAIKSFNSALVVYKRNGSKYDHAVVKTHLGLALAYRGRIEDEQFGIDSLREACGIFDSLLQLYSEEQREYDIAKVQHYLGNTYGEWGIRATPDMKIGLLEKARDCYLEALSFFSPEKHQLRWANTQNNLGHALLEMGLYAKTSRRVDILEEALKALNKAAKVRVRADYPLDWAQTQTNIGIAHLNLSQLDKKKSKTLLLEAKKECESALEIRTREKLPVDWAKTQFVLGNIFEELFNSSGEKDGKYLKEAREKYKDCLKVFQEKANPYKHNMVVKRMEAMPSLI